MSIVHLLGITTSLSRNFKATDVPHRFTLKIYTGGANEAPDNKAAQKTEQFRVEQGYVSADLVKRRFNFIPTYYEYTVQFQPAAPEPVVARPPVPPPMSRPAEIEPYGAETTVSNLAPGTVRFGGDPAAESLEGPLLRGDWPAIEEFLRSQPDSQLRDWYVTTLASEVGEYPQWLDEWVANRPGAYLPLLFRGYFMITWAWAVRTGQRARNVSDEQFQAFGERLAQAREDLEAAAGIAPYGEAGAFAFMIPVAMGLGYDKATVMQFYGEVQQRRPWHQLAHASMIQALAPKWSGSLGEMWGFAQSVWSAPAGSGAYIAVPHAHIEAAFESGADDYWRNPEVARAILTAAQRTIWAAGAYETPLTLNLHRAFLYCFIRMDDVEHAIPEFSAVNGRLGYPFTNLKDPAGAYTNALRRLTGQLKGQTR